MVLSPEVVGSFLFWLGLTASTTAVLTYVWEARRMDLDWMDEATFWQWLAGKTWAQRIALASVGSLGWLMAGIGAVTRVSGH